MISNSVNAEPRRTYIFDSFEDMIVIGEGTYGKVYKAELKKDPFCYKSVKREDSASENREKYRGLKLLKLKDEYEGFPITSLREILILKTLNHKNIV